MTELDKTKKDLELARANLARLRIIRGNQLVSQENLEKELEQTLVGRGDRVLDAIAADKDGDRVAWAESQAVIGKKAQLETNKDVLDALNPRIEAARIKVLECKANCFHAEADDLDKEADERQHKTDVLLEQLKEWEGCAYAPAIVIKTEQPSMLRSGMPYPVPGQSITMEIRRQAAYYRDCAEKILKGLGYSYDITGDGLPLFPIPEYLGNASECQLKE